MVQMLRAQRAMDSSRQWREQCRCLESSLLSSHSMLTVLAPHSQLCCQFESAEEAVYEMQTLPEQNCPVVLESEATLVGRFLPLYGPSKIEYRLLRYPDPDSAFAAAYHSMQSTRYERPIIYLTGVTGGRHTPVYTTAGHKPPLPIYFEKGLETSPKARGYKPNFGNC